jgi:hypothetical protein
MGKSIEQVRDQRTEIGYPVALRNHNDNSKR